MFCQLFLTPALLFSHKYNFICKYHNCFLSHRRWVVCFYGYIIRLHRTKTPPTTLGNLSTDGCTALFYNIFAPNKSHNNKKSRTEPNLCGKFLFYGIKKNRQQCKCGLPVFWRTLVQSVPQFLLLCGGNGGIFGKDFVGSNV